MGADQENQIVMFRKSGYMKVAAITFLGEQRGRPEDELKQLLSDYFKSELVVSSAFLLRVKYGDSPEPHVALCIRADDLNQHTVLEQAKRIFRKMFNTEQSLDIIFLSSEQVRQALEAGRPFYVQSAAQI